MHKFILLLIFSACFKTPDFSLNHTEVRLREIDKKALTNEDLDSKDLNLLFKTLKTPQILNKIDNKKLVKAVIFSKEKNLFRAYLEAFLNAPDSKNLQSGVKELHNENPKLLEAYLEYFSKEGQETIKSILL